MKQQKVTNRVLLALACALVMALSINLHAGLADRVTHFTLNQPVEIPGMVLQPGRYVMTLRAFQDGKTVQIFDQHQQHLYATLETRPNYLRTTPERTGFTLYESQPGVPLALKGWVLSGQAMSRDFIYPPEKEKTLTRYLSY